MERKQQDGKTELLEVVETKQGDLQGLGAVDGHPLAAVQARREDVRIQHFLSNQKAIQDHRQNEQQDSAKSLRLLGMLPDAFRYQDAGKEGSLIKLNFNTNPAFHPSGREAQVFHHMEGSIWFDPTDKRLARISRRLNSDVQFGVGILAPLAPVEHSLF